MSYIKKIITILSILIIISLALSACDRVFQVKRIDDGQVQEKKAEEQSEAEGEKVQKEKEEQEDQEDQEVVTVAKEVVTEAKKSEESENKNPQEEAEVPAISQVKEESVLSYLLLTDTYKDNQLGSMKLAYPVGEGHFVHLLAGYFDQGKKPVVVNISWEDYQGTIIYKEERKEIEADSFGFYIIYSLLGLTKRVPGQDKIPDAIGDYWVIIDIGDKIISKTKFSIELPNEG